MSVKAQIKRVPLVGPSLVLLHRRLITFRNSSAYWERRYRAGGNSGVGSYGRLAEFKANFLNSFVVEHQIASVIEYGCGDGAQLKLASYPSYTGVDISAKAVEMCRSTFASDTSKLFLQSNALMPGTRADLALSLDVVYHLVEDSVFEAYMLQLFSSARRFVIVYSSNTDQNTTSVHIRHRQFTMWVQQNASNWCLYSTVRNAYPFDAADPEHTSFADFYVFVSSKVLDSHVPIQ